VSATFDHIPLDVLLQDWLGEGDPAIREAVDVHLMACDACGDLLDELQALREGVRAAVQAGAVSFVADASLARRLAQNGVHLREYDLPHNGSVACSVAPHDQVLVSRLQAPLEGVQRLDATVELSLEPGVLHRTEDIPFDPAAGEVVFFTTIAPVRQRPAHTLLLTLLACEEGGSREVGRYVFHHSPWAG
jgi:hypothetical protein